MSFDDLERWIRDLRERLERGDLAALPPIELGHGTRHLAGETTVRVMLADLADLDDPDGSWGGDISWRDRRRRTLLGDFGRLRGAAGLARRRQGVEDAGVTAAIFWPVRASYEAVYRLPAAPEVPPGHPWH